MRVLVLSRPTPNPPPPEMMPALIEAFKAWREKYRSKMEMFEFFSAGAGGWGVLNTSDDVELSQIMMEFPFQPFSSNELIPTVNGDEALQRLGETFNQMMAAMQPKG
jgi:hypothetical protein